MRAREKYLTAHSSKARNTNIEILRIIIMLLIVASHFAMHSDFSFDIGGVSLTRMWWYVLVMGGNFGVDLFVLISGYFLSKSKTHNIGGKLEKLWGQLLFYSIILYLVGKIIFHVEISGFSLQTVFMPVSNSAWWFASTYFVLYIFHPYINLLFNNITIKELRWLIIVMLTCWCILPTLTGKFFESNSLIWFMVLYCVGAYVRQSGIVDIISRKVFIYAWLISTLLTYLLTLSIVFAGTKIPFLIKADKFFLGRQSGFTLLRAVSFMCIFLKTRIRTSHLINKIASATFGVYLIHDNVFVRELVWKRLVRGEQLQNSVFLIPYSMLVVIAVYSICTIVELIRIKWIDITWTKLIHSIIQRIYGICKRIVDRVKI